MESILSLSAKGFLFFSHAPFLAPLLLGGLAIEFFQRNNKSTIWQIACFILLFSMIFNGFLKSLFLVPLNPNLNKEGFAFPSGHMQLCVSFYGWLYWAYAHRGLRKLLLLLLAGIGYGLIQQGYHTPIDVLAALGFGIATVYGFVNISKFICKGQNLAYVSLCLILGAGLMLGVMAYRTGIPSHITKAFLGLCGFSVIRLLYLIEKWRPKS